MPEKASLSLDSRMDGCINVNITLIKKVYNDTCSIVQSN